MPTFRDNLHLGDKDPVIDSDSIADGAITTDKIEDQAITNDKMDCNSVGACQIIDGEVSLEKLTPGVQDMLRGAAGDYGKLEAKIKAVADDVDINTDDIKDIKDDMVKGIQVNGGITLHPDPLGVVHIAVGGGGGQGGDPAMISNLDSRLQGVENQVYRYSIVNGQPTIIGYKIGDMNTRLDAIEPNVDDLVGKASGIKQVVFLDYKDSDEPSPVEGKYWLDDSEPYLYKGVVENGTLQWKMQDSINGKLYVFNNAFWRINNDEVERLTNTSDEELMAVHKTYLDTLYIHRETGKLYWMGSNFTLSEVKPWAEDLANLPVGGGSGIAYAYISRSNPAADEDNDVQVGELWFDPDVVELKKRTNSGWSNETLTSNTLIVDSFNKSMYLYIAGIEETVKVTPWIEDIKNLDNSGVKLAYVSGTDPAGNSSIDEGEYWLDTQGPALKQRTDNDSWRDVTDDGLTKDTLFVGNKGIGFYGKEKNEVETISPWTADINQAITTLRTEIATAKAEAADAGHKVVIIAFSTANATTDKPSISGTIAGTYRDNWRHGLYWMVNTKPPVLYKGSYNRGEILWDMDHPVEWSQETLYIDRPNKKWYVYKDTNGGELVNVNQNYTWDEEYELSIQDDDSLITSIGLGGLESEQGRIITSDNFPASVMSGEIVRLFGPWGKGNTYRVNPLVIAGVEATYVDLEDSKIGQSYYYFQMPSDNLQITVNDYEEIVANPQAEVFDTVEGNTGEFTIVTESDGSTLPEEITEASVRSAVNQFLTPLYSNAAIGRGENNENDGRDHIWDAEEVGLRANLKAGETITQMAKANATAIKNALNDSTCIGIKLDTLYYVMVTNNVNGDAPGYHKAVDIVIPRDFIIDGTGQVEDPDTHEMVDGAVGGFIVWNSYGNLFYTEHSLNLRNVVTKLCRVYTPMATYYVNTNGQEGGTPHGIDQLIVDGCFFGGYEQYANTGSNYIAVYSDNISPVDSEGHPITANYINYIVVRDCTCNGGRLLYNKGLSANRGGRVDKIFCIIGNTITGIQSIGIDWGLAGDHHHAQAYMSCPMYVVGNTFTGLNEIWRDRNNDGKNISYYTAVLAEVATVYMLHNSISQFVSGVSTLSHDGNEYGGFSHLCTYDAYLSSRKVYYCHNIVENVLTIDTITTYSGVMKGKNMPSPRDSFWNIFSDTINPSIPTRYFKSNNYSIDAAKVITLWNNKVYRDGFLFNELSRFYDPNSESTPTAIYDHSEEAAWDNTLDTYVRNGTLLTLQFNGQINDKVTMDAVVVSDNTFDVGGCNIAGVSLGGQRWCCNQFKIEGNTFTAARMSSNTWCPASWNPNSGEYTIAYWLSSRVSLCLFGAIFRDSFLHPRLHIRNNTFNLSGQSSTVYLFERKLEGYTGDIAAFGTTQDPSLVVSNNTITTGSDISVVS